MNIKWQQTFRKRIRDFAALHPSRDGHIPVSIKIRVTSGCFHRQHSPMAYKIIDKHLALLPPDQLDFMFEEHESGPEILVYLAIMTAGISFAKSVIDLITAIIKARTEGIRQGDNPRDKLKLIIRRTRKNGDVLEKEVMKFETEGPIDKIEIEENLTGAACQLLSDELSEDR